MAVLVLQVVHGHIRERRFPGGNGATRSCGRHLAQLGDLRRLAATASAAKDRPSPETLKRLPRPDLVVIEGIGLMDVAEGCRAVWPGGWRW